MLCARNRWLCNSGAPLWLWGTTPLDRLVLSVLRDVCFLYVMVVQYLSNGYDSYNNM